MRTALDKFELPYRAREQRPMIKFDHHELSRITARRDNRDIDYRKIASIRKSIKAQGYLDSWPIVCSKELEVIDGHHRLLAASEEKSFVWVIVCESDWASTIKASGETTGKVSWSAIDFLTSWSKSTSPGVSNDYKWAVDFFVKEYRLGTGAATLLLNLNVPTYKDDLISGRLKITEKMKHRAAVVASWITDFDKILEKRTEGKFCHSHAFLSALVTLYEYYTRGLYDHSEMKRKIEQMESEFLKQSNAVKYLEMMTFIYNRKKQEKVRFEKNGWAKSSKDASK